MTELPGIGPGLALRAPAAATPASPDRQTRGDASPSARIAAIRDAATAFEAAFLAEMLRHAGLGAPRESFGGGPGEDRFAGLLAREYAMALAGRGGLGLAERLRAALLGRAGS